MYHWDSTGLKFYSRFSGEVKERWTSNSCGVEIRHMKYKDSYISIGVTKGKETLFCLSHIETDNKIEIHYICMYIIHVYTL